MEGKWKIQRERTVVAGRAIGGAPVLIAVEVVLMVHVNLNHELKLPLRRAASLPRTSTRSFRFSLGKSKVFGMRMTRYEASDCIRRAHSVRSVTGEYR